MEQQSKKVVEVSPEQEANLKKTWLKAIQKKLLKAESMIIMWEDVGGFRMATNIENHAQAAEVMVQMGNEVMGRWEEYQETVLAEHKRRMEETKQKEKIKDE